MAYPISDVTRRVVYSGSAGTGPYSFSFEVLANTDIAVYKNTTLLTLTTDYTVTINANGTGSVTLVSAATGSDNITLVGNRSIQRATDFVTGGDLFANSLNDEFDSLVIFSQQIKELANRGLKAPITDPTDVNMTLPIKSSRKGKVLAFDSTTGDPVNGPALDSMTTVIAQSANINTVAGSISNVNTVAGNTTNINTVAGIAGNVTTVAGVSSNVTTVAGIGSDVTTVAGISSAVSGVASISSAVSAVNSNSTNINTCATNISAINGASTQATNAANSATAAAASATAAAASYDSFDDRYLGSKSSAPSVDNDGNALLTGAIYWNSSLSALYIWTGSAWSQAAFEVTGGVSSFNTRTGAVTLSSTDVSTALGFTPSSTGKSVAMAIVFGG